MLWGKGGAVTIVTGAAHLRRAVEAYGASGPGSAHDIPVELVELRQVIDLLELKFSALAATFAGSDEYENQGSVSPVDWIRHNCKMSGSAASVRITAGRQLGRLPQSLDAVAEGRIGFAHLAMMASVARSLVESPTSSGFDESALLDYARQQSVGKFRYTCAHARHAGDPEGYAADEVAAVMMRELRLSACEDGMVLLSGRFDSAGGATIRTALEPLARQSGTHDDRTSDRRWADALVELSAYGLDTGAIPQRASQRTHMQVTTTLETLLGVAGAPAAHMEFSNPVSAKTVERLSCNATITRVLVDSKSMAIDVGRAVRVVPGPTRKAMNVQYDGCCFDGCERTSSWTDAHHLVHWTKGGPTDLPNLMPLCYRHHWMVHEGGWQLVKTEDGAMLAIPPPTRFVSQDWLLRANPGVR